MIKMAKEIKQQYLSGERAMFFEKDIDIYDSVFADGESPLKHGSNLKLYNTMFKWKYPLWYCKNVSVDNCAWFENARAGVWYTDDIEVKDSVIEAPKNFRRCNNVSLKNVTFPNAAETLWSCKNVKIDNVTAKGDYFAMNSDNITIDSLTLYGNYSFDGGKNITVKNSKLLSKDAFWNSENITVENSFISGEYLGWNSKNLTFINCTIESLQGLCYIENLVMKNCKLINTTLAFEYSSVDAEINSHIDSVFNPSSGIIKAESIGSITLDGTKVDPSKTKIITSERE